MTDVKVREIIETLGFDPTNHHNAAKCPYCTPSDHVAEVDRLTKERDEARAQIPPVGDGSCDRCGRIPSFHVPTNLCEECNDGVKRAEAAEQRISELTTANEADDELDLQTIQERDSAEELLDRMSYLIAAYFGAEIGEHSSINNPWQNAIELFDGREPLTANEEKAKTLYAMMTDGWPTVEGIAAILNGGQQ